MITFSIFYSRLKPQDSQQKHTTNNFARFLQPCPFWAVFIWVSKSNWFYCVTTMHDWLKKKPATFSSNQKQNQKSHDSLARVLPRVSSDTCVYFDWLRYYGVWLAQKTPPLCHPIRSKTKKTRVSLARVFPRFASDTCIYFASLLHLTCYLFGRGNSFFFLSQKSRNFVWRFLWQPWLHYQT